MGKKTFVKQLSVMMSAALIGFNFMTVSARAAEPSVVVSASQDFKSTEGTTIVSDPRITDLEKPKAGRNLDQEAIVRTNEGVSWNIPVIWLDENAETATICEAGKEYLPIFVFYLPEGIAISGENGYSVRLPEFVRDIYGQDDIISIVNPQAGVIYITSAKLAEAGLHNISVSNMEKSIAFSDASIENTYISNRNVFSSELSDPEPDSVADYNSRNFWNNQSYCNGPGWCWSSLGSSIVNRDNGNQFLPGSQNVWGEDYGSQNNNSGSESMVDLVATHCTSRAIQKIGRENLDNLVHLVRDVIEPQAVYQLTTKFQSYSKAAEEGELGKNIGLYIFSSSADSDADWRNTEGTYSYVAAEYSDGSMRYFIGVDVDSLYHMENGSYVLNDDAFDMLSTSMTHELMHAFMYDYTAAGMAGLPSDGNQYPSWFVEGMASTVDSPYSIRKNAFDLIQSSADPDEYDPYTYSAQAVLSFFNKTDSDYGNARLDNDNPDGDNRARDYVTGYVACMYLGYMAADNAGLKPEKVEWGVVKFDADVIRAGLDIVLEELHSGKSLNTVIGDVSNGSYSGLDDFEERFLKATDTGSSYEIDDENKNSLDFTKEFLNYLDFVSEELTGDSPQEVRASGSVLIPFDSEDQTIIKDQVPSDMPQQSVYVISDTNGFVNSTVSTDTFMASGGAYENGHGEISGVRMSVAAMASMDGEEPDITDESSTESQDTTNIAPQDTSDLDSQYIPDEGLQDTPQEAPQDTPQEDLQDMLQEDLQDTLQEDLQDTPQEAPQDMQ